jgi:O-antigen ligase
MLAAYLHMGLLSLLWLKIGEQRKSRIFFWRGSLLIILLAILLTKSRVLLGALVSLMIWELCRFRGSSQLKRVFITVFSMLTFLFSVLVIGSLWYEIDPVSIHFQQSKVDIQWNREPSHYQFRNRLAAALFIEHPILGVGLGKFKFYSAEPKEILDRHYPGFFETLPDKWFHRFHDPHSTYQGLAAETGVTGEMAILILLGTFLAAFLKPIKKAHSIVARERQTIFLAGFIGFLVHGFYMDILTLRYFWFLMGCSAAYRSVLK